MSIVETQAVLHQPLVGQNLEHTHIDEITGTTPPILPDASQMFVEYEIKYRHPAPYKARIFNVLSEEGLADPNTRLVRGDDSRSIKAVVDYFTQRGRKNIWMSVCHPQGENDPNAEIKERVNTPLFRDISQEGQPLLKWNKGRFVDKKSQERLEDYLHKNPNVFLKIFPQDRRNQSNISFVIGANDFAMNFKPNSHTTRDLPEYTSGQDISIDGVKSPLDSDQLIIYSDSYKAINILYPLLNSQDYLKKMGSVIQDNMFPLRTYNPEFMIHLQDGDLSNLKTSSIEFTIDFISGIAPEFSNKVMDISSFLEKLPSARILPNSAKRTLQVLETVFVSLSEASQGTPPHPGDINTLNVTLRSFSELFPYIQGAQHSLINLISAVSEGDIYPLNGKALSAPNRLNILYEREKTSPKIVAEVYSTLKQMIANAPTVSDVLTNQ